MHKQRSAAQRSTVQHTAQRHTWMWHSSGTGRTLGLKLNRPCRQSIWGMWARFEPLGSSAQLECQRVLEAVQLPAQRFHASQHSPREITLGETNSRRVNNTRKYPPIETATAGRLREYFEPHNAALEALLGEQLHW